MLQILRNFLAVSPFQNNMNDAEEIEKGFAWSVPSCQGICVLQSDFSPLSSPSAIFSHLKCKKNPQLKTA